MVSRKSLSAAAISLSAFRVTCAVILICAAAAVGFGGQNAGDDLKAQAAQFKACEAEPLQPAATFRRETAD